VRLIPLAKVSPNCASTPETYGSFRFKPRPAQRDVTPRQRSLYLATICLILRPSGRSPHSTFPQPLPCSTISAAPPATAIDDHHILPCQVLDLDRASTLAIATAWLQPLGLIGQVPPKPAHQLAVPLFQPLHGKELARRNRFPILRAVLSKPHLIPHGPEVRGCGNGRLPSGFPGSQRGWSSLPSSNPRPQS